MKHKLFISFLEKLSLIDRIDKTIHCIPKKASFFDYLPVNHHARENLYCGLYKMPKKMQYFKLNILRK